MVQLIIAFFLNLNISISYMPKLRRSFCL